MFTGEHEPARAQIYRPPPPEIVVVQGVFGICFAGSNDGKTTPNGMRQLQMGPGLALWQILIQLARKPITAHQATSGP